MSESLVVQRPDGPAPQLILLFHGLGQSPQAMLPLARRMAAEWPQAFVACIASPEPADSGEGWQWYPAAKHSEVPLPRKVAAAMPRFLATIAHWQLESGAAAEATALVGFSQGAIMALEAAAQPALIAGRVVALSGRYADTPRPPPSHTTLHFVHGKQDRLIPYRHTVEAAEALIAAGADLTADVLPFVDHEIDDRVQALVIERLRTHVPAHRWQEAMRAARALGQRDDD